MARTYYEFATNTRTGWLHKLVCDLCRFTLERIGAPPKGEHGEIPAAFSSKGWATFSMRASAAPADDLTMTEELWPDLNRDLCPSCAKVIHSVLCDYGVNITPPEYRYLDALGREVPESKPRGAPYELGVRLCRENQACWLLFGHNGPCIEVRDASPELAGLVPCSVCWNFGDDPPRRLFELQQLESHAVDHHRVHWGGPPDASSIGMGWYTESEDPRIYYGDVQAALMAELHCMRTRLAQLDDAEIERLRLTFR